jgi:hypothetical protein
MVYSFASPLSPRNGFSGLKKAVNVQNRSNDLKTISKIALVILILLLSGLAHSADEILFEYASGASAEPREHRISLARDLGRIQRGGITVIEMPEGDTYEYRVDRVVTHASGSRTLSAFHLDTRYRLVLTYRGLDVIRGSMLVPPGRMMVFDPRDDGLTLVEITKEQVRPGIRMDFGAPPAVKRRPGESSIEAEGEAADASSYSVIDLLVLHTPSLEDPVDTIEHMVETGNIAFRDSDVAAEFRLVHVMEVDYPDSNDSETTTRAMQRNDPPFEDLEAMRDEFGADLVLMVRPLDWNAHGNCGWAFILGGNGGNVDQPRWAYGSVSEGTDDVANRYCADSILAHEAGHLMGSAHDLEHQTLAGAYSYSNGYGFDGLYGTVMSYYFPSVARFSSPRISCDGIEPCGIPAGEAGEADNARSLEQTRSIVANFRSTSVPFQVESGLWGIDAELVTGEPGRGFQLVYQGNTLVLTYFGYTESGESVFYQASGPVAENAFQGELLEFVGGTVIGGDYRPAVLSGTAGQVTLTFTSSSTGTIQLPGEPVYDVSLFVFDQ